MARWRLSRHGPPVESGESGIGLPRHELRLHRKRVAGTVASRVTLLADPKCGHPVPADALAGLCSRRRAAGAFSEAVRVCTAKTTLRVLIRGRVPLFNSAWQQSLRPFSAQAREACPLLFELRAAKLAVRLGEGSFEFVTRGSPKSCFGQSLLQETMVLCEELAAILV